MALSTWTAKCKKSPEGGDEEPAKKVLRTQYEKNVKKMEGDLRLVKDCTLCRKIMSCVSVPFACAQCNVFL